MLIKVEPADFFMYRVILVFDQENGDSEDQQVRDYLAEHELEPRYQSSGEYEGRQCEVMQFGGCYLGRHLQQIGQIQRHEVEVELLTAEVERHLEDSSPQAPSFPAQARQEAVAQLVQNFHQEASFQNADSGELVVVLDGEAVREAARQMIARLPAP